MKEQCRSFIHTEIHMEAISEIHVTDLGAGEPLILTQTYAIEKYRGTSIIVSEEHMPFPSKAWPPGALIVHPVLFETVWAVDIENPNIIPTYRGLADCRTRKDALDCARHIIDQASALSGKNTARQDTLENPSSALCDGNRTLSLSRLL
jgi:hypothetical protein